ncbi:MAG: hypothetical protein ACRD63_03105, partial [Pyrinomonadaceae bacterium]
MTTTSALPESIAESFGEDLIVKQKPEAFSLPAFAKINLELRVLGHRPDGMHEIRTILQTVSLHDLLTFSLRSDNQVIFECRYKSHYLGESDESGVTDEIKRKDVPSDNTNSVCKAAELLRRYAIERRLSLDP